ncbi:MAG TPA: ABC transporter ATP-binding protein [Casimicrobiaceae bacterium]|nr:ABC transporter ATP-binding protein [Casimicrobiaceae bacterium]
MPHLRFDRVTKFYATTRAVHEVELTVEQGELLTLLGPSGCGKTSLLRLAAGFIEPTRGRVLIDDADVTRLPPNRRSIGMVFQSYALFPHLTVARNIGFSLEERGEAHARIRRRVDELLELIGLPDSRDRYPAQLSGGQQQRVALARAIAYAPRVLLMDEPLGALDLKLREAMQLEIRRIQKTLGITTLYVTHDQSEAMRISDRIAVMNAGAIEQCGTTAEIYASPHSQFVANFMGKINLVQGSIVALDPYAIIVRTELGMLRAARSNGVAVGEQVVLGIRPDEIEVIATDTGDNRFDRVAGTIEDKIFIGTFDEIRLRLPNSATFQVETRPGRAGCIGERLEIGWDPCHCKLFRQ